MKKNPAYEAVCHIVRRVQADASFSWLMIGTESLALCYEAIAEHEAKPVDEVRKSIEDDAALSRETPEIVTLRKRVDELERHEEDSSSQPVPHGRNDKIVMALEQLAWNAECGSHVTLDALRQVLQEGKCP